MRKLLALVVFVALVSLLGHRIGTALQHLQADEQHEIDHTIAANTR